MLGYFELYYSQLQLGYIFIVTNYLIAGMIPVLFADYDLKRPKSMAMLLFHIAMYIAAMEAIGVLLFVFFKREMSLPVIGGVILLALTVIASRRYPLTKRVMLAFAYAGCFSGSLGTSVAIGIANAVEDFLLQNVLVALNVMLIGGIPIALRRAFDGEKVKLRQMLPVALLGTVCFLSGDMTRMMRIRPTLAIPLNLILLTLLLLTMFLTISIPSMIRRRNRENGEKLLRMADENMLRILDEKRETYNRIRHDMRNQYTAMQGLLDRKEYDRLAEYLNEYSGQLVTELSPVACANRTVSVVLTMEKEKAEKAGLNMHISVAVPEEMGFANPDLCSILTNLSDNAIEYLESKKELAGETVRVEVNMIHQSLIITVTNPILPEDERRALELHTLKGDKDMHGYGTRIVASIAKSYQGAVSYKISDGCFEAGVMLTEPQGGAK